MGKVCTKDVLLNKQDLKDSATLHTASHIQEDSEKKKKVDTNQRTSVQDISRLPSGQPNGSFCAPDVRPPHSVLKQSINDLSTVRKFYVHIYGLKARNLHVKQNRSDATTFCVINWDDFSFERRTKKSACGIHPKWEDTMQFYYSVPSLEKLGDRFLVLHVYEELSNKSRIIGLIKVNLLTVASGPIHHDLRLEPVGKTVGRRPAEVGRLIFDIRMAQVCQLIISPVEILVHMHQSLDALDRLEVEGIGTKRPPSLSNSVHQFDSQQLTHQLSPNIPEGHDQDITNTSLHHSTLTSPIIDQKLLSSSLPDQLSSTSPSHYDSQSTITPSLSTPSLSMKRRRWGDSSFHSGPLELNIPSNSSPDDLGSCSGLLARMTSVRSILTETLPKEGDEDDFIETVLEREAIGGHSDADALDPYLAEWQLTFVPTGVDNPYEYCSAWTSVCDQPYWNSVDHTIINELTDDTGFISQLTQTTDSVSPKPTIISETELHNDITHAYLSVNIPDETTVEKETSHLDTQKRETVHFPPLNTLSPGQQQQQGRPQLLHIPLSVAELKQSKIEAHHVLPTPPIILNPVSTCIEDASDINRLHNATDSKEYSSGLSVPNRLIPSATLLHSMSAQHLAHLDTQATYKKLAATCARGRLVREMLYDDLPTIQLETTSDFLRQNHLKLRLYAKRLGFTAPEFFGEAWLPFFKIYDADIVEQMHQNFSDAYFHEKLWFEGKCIGHIEGIIVFQNNPMIRQMLAGVNTDGGFMRISPPILGAEQKSMKFMFRGQDTLPEEIKKISQLHQTLLDVLYTKTQHVASEAGIVKLQLTNTSGGTSLTKLNGLFNLFPHRKQKIKSYLLTGGIKDTQLSPRCSTDSQLSQQEFHNVCDQVLQLLRTSHVETRRSFLYQSEMGLLIGQHVFLNLANHVLEFGDYVPWQYRSTYSALLHHILRRGELDIGSCLPDPPELMKDLTHEERFMLHFAIKHYFGTNKHISSIHTRRGSSACSSESELGLRQQKRLTQELIGSRGRVSPKIEKLADTLTSEQDHHIIMYHKRMKLCRQYFILLHRVLKYCLQQLDSDSVFEGQRKYISIFLCILYFRLPSFRETLLCCVLNGEERDADIPEWRGTEFELTSITLKKLETWQTGCEYRLMLDWEPLYDSLNTYFGADILDDNLNTISDQYSTWKTVFTQRGSPFFSFLEHWAKHVYQAIPQKQGLQWHTLPGYASLLKALLLEMRQRDVTRYPDALLNCSGALLANERLLSVFIKILFLKTSVHNSSAVFAALNYVDYWIQVLSLRNQPLPPNFDLRFLCRGLDIVLGSDLGLCIAKGLWFIYKNLPILKESQIKIFLIDLLFEKYFFTLFLSWSWLVRRCFMWFLLYRVCETTRVVLMQDTTLLDPAESKHVSQRPHIGTTIGTSEEQKVMIWGYMEFSRYLSIMNGPSVFPKHVTCKRLPALILEGGEDFHSLQTSETTNRPRSRSEATIPPGVVLTDTHTGHGSLRMTIPPTGGTISTSHLFNDNLNNVGMIPMGQESRVPPHLRDMIERVKLLSHTDNTVSQRHNTTKKTFIPEKYHVYIKTAIPEFFTELQIYRNWVAAGADPLPTMNIPASPLDNNVDVPADN